jgi:cytochrome P450
VTGFARALGRRLAAWVGRPLSLRPAEPSPGESFDLDHPDATRQPFPAFERLRAAGPVHFLPRHGCWILIGHEEVRKALAKPQLFSSDPQAEVDAVLLGADPPGHGLVRRLVAATPTIAAQGPLAARIAAEASALVGERFDLVADYVVPLARRAAALVVGLEERELNAILTAPDISSSAAQMSEASRDLLRRADLYRSLLDTSGGLLDDERALSLVRLLCRASTETTERLLVRAAAALLADPPMRRRLEESPALLASFIEEMMRLYPPEPNLVRRATRDVRLGARAIPAGATVFLSLLCANRDPRVFPNPGEVRLDRARTRHLAFGGGPHQCVGAGLARRIASIALQTLFDPARPVSAAEPLEGIPRAVDQGIETPRRLLLTT